MNKLSLVDIKKKNYSDVYSFIYKNKKSSKQAIAQNLHMSLPTVSQHLNTLLSEGLIEQGGYLESQIGRKATGYSIIPDVRIAMGVEIIKQRITIVSVNLFGELIDYERVQIPFQNDDVYFKKVCAEVMRYIKEHEFKKEQILGVGFTIQGLVNSDNSRVTYAKILPMENLTIDAFSAHLPYPCRLFHDSECAAANTLWHQPEIDTAIYLSLSHHLGGAVIINGEIQQGRMGKSGTMEHMTLFPGGKPCYCGKSGCAECYCSADALLREDEDLETFFTKKGAGDSDFQKRWREFLDHLALLVTNVHLVIDSVIIIGGHMAAFMEDEDFEYLHQKIREITAFPEDAPFIFPGSRRPHEIPIGAAMGYITEFLESI